MLFLMNTLYWHIFTIYICHFRSMSLTVQIRRGLRRRDWWAWCTYQDTSSRYKEHEKPLYVMRSKPLQCLLACRSCQSWLMRRIWRACQCSSLPTNRIWPQHHRPARSPRDSTCTPTGIVSGRFRPARLCLGKASRLDLLNKNELKSAPSYYFVIYYLLLWFKWG